jgi:hypothetical protein
VHTWNELQGQLGRTVWEVMEECKKRDLVAGVNMNIDCQIDEKKVFLVLWGDGYLQ